MGKLGSEERQLTLTSPLPSGTRRQDEQDATDPFHFCCATLPAPGEPPKEQADMGNLVAAAVFFLAIHFGVSGTALRARLVGAMGEKAFRGLFSLASLAGLLWLIKAYGDAPRVELWGQLLALKPLGALLVLLAFLLVVIGLATPSPTVAGMERQLSRDAPARGIIRITRHPFLWGVALWALVHLTINGDLASVILFGSLLVLAVGGTASIDRKRRLSFGENWQRFVLSTSNVPFAAIASGRNQLGAALREIGIVRPLIAVAIYAAAFVFHARIFGVPAG